MKFLVVLINKDLILNCQDDTITKTARLFFLRRLRRPDTDSTVLCNSYKSILTDGITTKSAFALASTVPLTAQHITRKEPPSMGSLYTQRCRRKANRIIRGPTQKIVLSATDRLAYGPAPPGPWTFPSNGL